MAHQARQIEDRDLAPGSRVALLGANSVSWVASYLAVMRAGHTAVPFAPVLTPDDVVAKMAHVGCDALLVDEKLTRRFARVVDRPHHTVSSTGVRELLSSGADCALPEVGPAAATAVLVFTSGTTSRPRAVQVSHGNLLANTASIVDYLGLQRDDRMLVALPFSYCFGASLLHTHLAVGGSVRLCETQAFPETIVEGIAAAVHRIRRGAVVLPAPPARQLVRVASPAVTAPPPAGGWTTPRGPGRTCCGRTAARPALRDVRADGGHLAAGLPPARAPRCQAGLGGEGDPWVALRITDENGDEVPTGSVGEIRARGANVTQGYWQDPEGTAEKYIDGELRTGDFGRMDEDGFLHIVDRRDDFIKSWGYRVSSHEIEDAVLELRAVAGAAAVGCPDTQAGEAVVLFATLRPGHELGVPDIEAHLRARLAKHLVPQEVRLVDQLPLNQNGKVVKTELRALARTLTDAPPADGTSLIESGGQHV